METPVKLTTETICAVTMRANRSFLEIALEIAARRFDQNAIDAPGLALQFKRQANEARGLIVAMSFADAIVLTD
jgi:hypothetical protein